MNSELIAEQLNYVSLCVVHVHVCHALAGSCHYTLKLLIAHSHAHASSCSIAVSIFLLVAIFVHVSIYPLILSLSMKK